MPKKGYKIRTLIYWQLAIRDMGKIVDVIVIAFNYFFIL